MSKCPPQPCSGAIGQTHQSGMRERSIVIFGIGKIFHHTTSFESVYTIALFKAADQPYFRKRMI